MSKTKIGFHTAIGGNKRGLGDWERALNQAGIPFFIKSADEYGILDEALRIGEDNNVENHLIFRIVMPKPFDVPNYSLEPSVAADEYWERTLGIDRFPPEFDKEKVWLDILNEPRAQYDHDDPNWNNMNPVDWLGWFSVRIGEIALEQGYKVVSPSFNSGEPPVADYEQLGMLAYLKMCGDYPTRIGLSVHEYSWSLWQTDPDPNNWYPYLWGRLEAAIAACDKNGISRDFSIFGTEFGFGHEGSTIPPVNLGMEYLEWYDVWAAKWPQLKGVGLWQLGMGWANISEAVQKYIAPLTSYSLTHNFDMGEQPARTYMGTLPNESTPSLIKNNSFENGWSDIFAGYGDLINQKPHDWNIQWADVGDVLWAKNLATGEYPVVTTVPECIHKLNEQLPPNEQVGGEDALILDGLTVYKQFAYEGVWGTKLSQQLTDLDVSMDVEITIPIQVHYQGALNEPDDVEIWIEANDSKTIAMATPDLPDREWAYLTVVGSPDSDGKIDLTLSIQTKWANSRDFFMDNFSAKYVTRVIPPEKCRGLPRIDYRRVMNVYPINASTLRVHEITQYAIDNGRQSVSGSYDDGGIGDLSNKKVVLWDIPMSRVQEFADWYAIHYAGTIVTFMDVIDDTPSEGWGIPWNVGGWSIGVSSLPKTS